MSSKKRRHERFIRRLETEFTAENKNYRGISGNLSINGLFLRTNHAFAPGTILDITMHLPDGKTAHLKGKVMRALKTPIVSLKNGMGIELIENDSHYINFMKSFSPDEQEEIAADEIKPDTEPYTKMEKTTESASPDFLIISCPECSVKNKVHQSKISLYPKCGKCGSLLNMA